MKEITHGAAVFRCPFSDLFRPLSESEEADLRQSIDAIGIGHPVFVYDSETWGDDCIIDGVNRLRIADELGIDAPIQKLTITDDTARKMAEDLNISRRQVTPSEAEAARAKRLERIERVVAAREDGKSLRAIAEDEDVSVVQVQRDLADSGVPPPGTPDETPENVEVEESDPEPEPEPAPVVEGRDGKRYPARRPNPNPPPQRDPDHPYAKQLQAVVNLATVISAMCNQAGPDDKIRQYLLNMGFVFPRAKIVNGRNYGWKCVGLRGLYRAIHLAGLPGKAKSKQQLLKEVAAAMNPDEDKE